MAAVMIEGSMPPRFDALLSEQIARARETQAQAGEWTGLRTIAAIDSIEPEERLRAAIDAVSAAFPQLTRGELLDPPASMFDAKGARHVAMHIAAHGLSMTKRRVADLLGCTQNTVYVGCRLINQRIEASDTFARFCSRLTADARARLAARRAFHG